MSNESYFSFFGLPVSFNIDVKELKKKYLLNTRKFHPDFFTLENQTVKDESLDMSSYNNEAYKILSNQNKRINYILKLKEVLLEEGQNTLPPSFLMEMMDLNEQIMDFKMGENNQDLTNTKLEVTEMKNSLEEKRASFMLAYDEDGETNYLDKIKDITLKLRYLRRMEQNLYDDEVEL